MRQQPSWSQQVPHRRLLLGIHLGSTSPGVLEIALIRRLKLVTKLMMVTIIGILRHSQVHGIQLQQTHGLMWFGPIGRAHRLDTAIHGHIKDMIGTISRLQRAVLPFCAKLKSNQGKATICREYGARKYIVK